MYANDLFGEWGEEVEADEFLVKINAFFVSRFISIILFVSFPFVFPNLGSKIMLCSIMFLLSFFCL